MTLNELRRKSTFVRKEMLSIGTANSRTSTSMLSSESSKTKNLGNIFYRLPCKLSHNNSKVIPSSGTGSDGFMY